MIKSVLVVYVGVGIYLSKVREGYICLIDSSGSLEEPKHRDNEKNNHHRAFTFFLNTYLWNLILEVAKHGVTYKTQTLL